MNRPFSDSWLVLKRQTTLGEFHPDFPSPHGPVTLRRFHPTKKWGKGWLHTESVSESEFNPDEFQPYENLITEGLKPQAPTLESVLWEQDHIDDDIKPFTLDETTLGNWFYPTGKLTPHQRGLSHEYFTEEGNRKQIGVRMPIEQLQGQFRNLGYMGEAPEAHIINHIPPQYLVQLPDNYEGEGIPTFGKRGEINE
jgi:hypothetical protein|tara:strand:+ start:515 stop:1102 length:588 start_codon:yes stop_codon:yes gene_type:complete